MDRIKVSLVVPVCNVEKYLNECLESALAQTLKDIEIICVDDGSTDSSPSILKEFAARDARIKIITKPNAGYGHTMNRGMAMAQGEYIGILESDDCIDPEMCSRLYAEAKKQDLDVVKSDFYRFETVDGKKKLTYVPLTDNAEWYGRVIDPRKEPKVLKLKMNTWTGLYRRSFLEENGIAHHESPGASYQDNGFFFQTMCLAERVGFVRRAFYLNRRDNPNSSVFSKGKVYTMCGEMAFVKDFLKSREELWDIFKDQYFFKLLHNYEFTYMRIAQESRAEFINRISAEFKDAEACGDLNVERVYTKSEAERVRILIDDPASYPSYGATIALRQRISALESELNAIKGSMSFRIGRAMTALPRRLVDLLRR